MLYGEKCGFTDQSRRSIASVNWSSPPGVSFPRQTDDPGGVVFVGFGYKLS